jgi:DUF1680 family protein
LINFPEKTRSGIIILWIILTLFGCTKSEQNSDQDVDLTSSVDPKTIIKVYPFELSQVHLLDSPFKRAMELDRDYLKGFKLNRLVHMFRLTAGLPSSAKPLGGWEEGETIGCFPAHFLTASALMYANTGDEQIKARADSIVMELARCQQAFGTSGYLSAFPKESFDRLEAGEHVVVVWYILHKIMAGLLDMYIYCGNEQALDVVKGMASWAKKRTDRLSTEHMQQILEREFGGINDIFARLFAVSRNPDHLVMAKRFDHKRILDPLAQHKDELTGLHVNTQLPKFIGAAQEYEMTGEVYYREIASYSWETIVNTRSFATGGTSNYEHWRAEPNKLANELSAESQETCCSYNMLKLTRHLFTWNPDVKYADYYERTLYNSILATQHPENGMMMYYCSMQPGFWKVFNTPRNSFWCCTGTGIESHAKYGNSIYFHNDTDLYVNLFIASEVKWEQKDLLLRQVTNFPEEESTTLTIKTRQPTKVTIHVRIPYWTNKNVIIKINGNKQDIDVEPASYVTLDRTWQDNDNIELVLPMRLHLAPLADGDNLTALHNFVPQRNYRILSYAERSDKYDFNLAAIMYGPVVLAGELGTKDFTPDLQFVADQEFQHRITPMEVPDLLINEKNPANWIKAVQGKPLTFRTVGVGQPNDVSLVPYHKLFDQRYTLYWRIIREK